MGYNLAMPNDAKEQKTVGYYDTEAEEWVSAHGGSEGDSYWKDQMAKFHELLPNGKVLEVGSGAGKDAAALISLGYDYTGTDASEGLLKIAQRRNPGAKFERMAVNDLEFPEGEFDGFWTSATLLHIPKSGIDGSLERIKRVVKPGGIGFISVKQGGGEKEDEETGRWFAFYTKDEFSDILGRNGYEILESETRVTEEDTWLVFYVKS